MANINRFAPLSDLPANDETLRDEETQTAEQHVNDIPNGANNWREGKKRYKKHFGELHQEIQQLRQQLSEKPGQDISVFPNSAFVQCFKNMSFFTNGCMIYTTFLLSAITFCSFKGYSGEGPKNASSEYVLATQATLLFCLGEHFGALSFFVVSILHYLDPGKRPFALFLSSLFFIPLSAFITNVLTLSNDPGFPILLVSLVSAVGSFGARCLGTDGFMFKTCLTICLGVKVSAFIVLAFTELNDVNFIFWHYEPFIR